MRVLVARGRRINLLLAWDKGRRLLSHEDFKDRARLSRPRPDQGFQSVRTDDMFPFPSAQTCEVGLPSEARIPRFWDNVVLVISGIGTDTVCSFSP